MNAEPVRDCEQGPIVVLDGLVKRFGTRLALAGLTARIGSGQITGLAGPDGAGKTTLLRLMAGLLHPDGGTVTILGQDALALARARTGAVGYMPQRFGLYEDLTVSENLRLYADLHEMNPEARTVRVAELLTFTGLHPFVARRAGDLSGGMKQKLGLACCLIAKPRLLLLDEPSVGVDPVSRRELWRIVSVLVGDGMSVVWSTAYLDEAERCDAVLMVDAGRLVASGPPGDFLAPLRGRTYLATVPPADKRALQRSLSRDGAVTDALIQGESVRVVVKDAAFLPGLPHGASLRPVAPRFEDAFVSLLKTTMDPTDPVRRTARDAAGGAETGAPVIEVKELSRLFGRFKAVDQVSFTVERGEIFGLLGPNGAGKSTCFRMLCGLLAPSSGLARVAGFDLGHARADARAHLGYMAQRFSLYGDLTVRQNLTFFGGAYGLSGRRLRDRMAWVLDEFSLETVVDQAAGALPLGFKQRLALGAALIHGPQILFLDEPTSGVDPLTRRAFWARIADLADQGVTVLVTSHFMDEAEYCDRLGIVYRGQLIATGSPDRLKAAERTEARPEPTLEDAFIALIETYDRTKGADLRGAA